MNNSRIILIISIIITFHSNALYASDNELPRDFYSDISGRFAYIEHIRGAGGNKDRLSSAAEKHFPVIMVPANLRDKADWSGSNPGNASNPAEQNVYERFIRAGFLPAELWIFEYTEAGRQMRNIEELTDGLRAYIYAIVWYTKASKVQILGHGEGAVLAAATLKKYNLYNIVHSVVYIAGPFHGASLYSYTKALEGRPVHANLAPDSDFLRELNYPDETPFVAPKKGYPENIKVKYMTLRSRDDEYYKNDPGTAGLKGAQNIELNDLDHDGLRVSPKAADIYLPFLGDKGIPYKDKHDKDNDGFMGEAFGGPDRDDKDPLIYPGAKEIPGDNIDQDCNGMDRAPWGGRDVEIEIRGNFE